MPATSAGMTSERPRPLELFGRPLWPARHAPAAAVDSGAAVAAPRNEDEEPHAAALRHSRRLSERRADHGGLVEGRGRYRHHRVQRPPRRGGQRRRGAERFRHRLRHARAHRIPARGDRSAAEPETPDHDRHAQRLDRSRSRQGGERRRLRHAVVRQCHRRARRRPDARTRPPHRLRERPPQGRRRVAIDHRPRSRGPDAGAPRPRPARHQSGADRQGSGHAPHRLEPESHRGEMPRRRRRRMSTATTCSAAPISSRSICNCRRAPAA